MHEDIKDSQLVQIEKADHGFYYEKRGRVDFELINFGQSWLRYTELLLDDLNKKNKLAISFIFLICSGNLVYHQLRRFHQEI